MEGLSRDLNPGPPAPKAGIIPLDHWATGYSKPLAKDKIQCYLQESNFMAVAEIL